MQGDGDVGPDHSVEIMIRRILEPVLDKHGNDTGESATIWPARFDKERVDQLRREFGSLFFLLYMNEASDPNLVDFDIDMIRKFKLNDTKISFDLNHYDACLEEKWKNPTAEDSKPLQGTPLNADTWDMHFGDGRGRYMRLKYG
jgi:hypothetical protein